MLLYSQEKDSQTKEYEVINQEDAKELGWSENELDVGYDGKFYLKGFAPVKPTPTDDEISATRYSLYRSVSDPLFQSYNQGVGSLQDYIDAKAQIGFDNKKSTQTAMTLDDFKHKVQREYELFKQHNMPVDKITYAYKESNSSDVTVGNETITLVRMMQAGNVVLPEITGVQIVKIDNISDNNVSVIPFKEDFLDGVNNTYIIPPKKSFEIIADKTASLSGWDTYTAPLELETSLPTFKDLFNNSYDNVKNVTIGMNLTLQKVSEDEVKIEAVDKDNTAAAYYASLNIPTEVVARDNSPIHKGVLWFDNTISAVHTNMLAIDRANKSIGLQDYLNEDANVTGGLPYLCVLKASLRGRAPADGFVQLYLLDKTTGLPAQDENGAPISIYKTYKEGDKLGVIRTAGIIKAKGLKSYQVRMATNFPANEKVMLNDHTDGNSCVLFLALTNNYVNDALLKYEIDNNEKVLMAKRWVGELYTIRYLSQHNMSKTTGEAGQGETDADGSHFYNKYKMNIEVANNSIIFSSFENELCFFNWGKILDADLTKILRGDTVSVDIVLTNPDCAVNVQMVKWTGTPDQYTDKIITDNVNDADVFEAGWEAVDNQFIAENNTRQAVTKIFTVPKDAMNIAFIISPTGAQNPVSITIHSFTVSSENPRNAWILKGFMSDKEKQMEWKEDEVTTWTPLDGMRAYRFSGTDTPNKLPMGKLKSGDIPADLTPWKVKEGVDTGVENDWTFYDDANIEVDAVVNLHVKTLGEVVYFFLTKEGKEIQGSRVSVTMSENTVDNALKVPTMKAKVQNGDLIGWAFQSTTKGGAWLETDSVAHPLATVTIRTEGAV